MGELAVVNSDGSHLQNSSLVLGSKSFTVPDPPLFCTDCLSAAEEAAEQVVNSVHPTLDSEEKRRDVIDYVQRLIKSHLNCEVFPYGSVPLKTYLPDGDIDFTVLKVPNAEESLAQDVFALLKMEEENENAEFEVKDTQFIDAEVKLVKCLVRNIVIDISFNQLGGFSTLCFLEQVDRLVGKNHLFKRSIVLVKAWCYYESRILGAHHGLMSTYALETLVLYIFHMFHSSLRGPLEVLYRFLEYYSHFDWDNYCISLKGPVCKSTLPDIVVKLPESGWEDLLLTEEILTNCIELFSVSSRKLEKNPKTFQSKHLNIIDPLKENNNLGRSVHRGNFYRIRSAFRYGARQLGQVLSGRREDVADEISDFFASTLERHANDYASSIKRLVLEFGEDESLTASLSLSLSLSSPIELLSEDGIPDNDSAVLEFKSEVKGSSMRELPSEMGSEHYSAEESHDNVTPNSSVINSTSDYTASLKPSCFSSKLSTEFESLETGNSYQSDIVHNADSNLFMGENEEHEKMDNTHQWCMDNSQPIRRKNLKSIGGELEAFDPLADLSGDYDSHIRSLLYGQFCHGFSLSASEVCNPPSPPSSRIQTKKPWDIIRQSLPFWQCQLSRMTSSQPQPVSTCPSNDSAVTVFHCDRIKNTRGTGTYFPQVNGYYRDRCSQGRGRYKNQNQNLFHRQRSNVSEHDRSRFQGRGESPRDGNGYLSGLCKIEFGSIGNLAQEMISDSVGFRGSSRGASASPKKHCTTTGVQQEREGGASLIHLKNEVEFPPLC